MSSTGSFSMSGLLGGTAGQIDVNSLISSLMQAASIPQQQLADKLSSQQYQISAYQTINTKLAALLTAGQKLTDANTWAATSATSTNTSVVATSTAGAPLGSTSFNVTQLAQAQVSTIQADASGNVLTAGTTSISINGTAVTAATGSATDVASAINSAGLGVTANVITADNPSGGTMQLLQLTSTKTGSASAFTIGQTGLTNASQDIIAAQDAQVSVGDPATGGYTVSSSTNSFKDVVPGVTFSVSAPASNVTITVSNGLDAISSAVQSLVNAANAATSEMNKDTDKDAVLAINTQVETISQSILSAVSAGTASGQSLNTYGISIDKNGVMSFDATAFASAYNADPTATENAITDFATALNTTTGNATDPTYGAITTAITAGQSRVSDLNDQISNWNDRLSKIQDAYTAKFTAMETALAKLQSQQTYLTSMFKSMSGSSDSSSS